MAEYLTMSDQVMRRRVENAMQQWERYAEIQIQQFHARLDGQLFDTQQRLVAHDRDQVWTYGQALMDRGLDAGEPMSAVNRDSWIPYEPTQAEQQAYEDRPYDRSEAVAHGDAAVDPAIGRESGLEVSGTGLVTQFDDLQARLEVLDQRTEARQHDQERGY